MKTQHFAGLSLLLVYAVEVVKHHHLKLIYVVILVRVFISRVYCFNYNYDEINDILDGTL